MILSRLATEWKRQETCLEPDFVNEYASKCGLCTNVTNKAVTVACCQLSADRGTTAPTSYNGARERQKGLDGFQFQTVS